MDLTTPTQPSLPGGIMLSRIKVYDSTAPDGQHGGTPHLHLACAETYVLMGGRGAVELIDYDGFRRVDLCHEQLLGFTPGTVHRLINLDGALAVLVIMQNAGLPERGDAVITFPTDTLSDAARYREAMHAPDLDAARQRRDLGVRGFLTLREAFVQSLERGRAALDEAYRLAIARTAERLPQWDAVVRQGPLRSAQDTLDQVAALKAGRVAPLTAGRAWTLANRAAAMPGMCGQITQVGVGDDALTPDGARL